ncbi:MarR family winged helix-turn-helix transcriptional regulator [Pelagibacterium montanilacus]|uniref:MarR family winged helix-turn-helix transcriptional regulator n=1 Tax=Pelagibacterium montanilacus TaxID=2185280 RepID=UPI000F8DF2A9|nr:MarR family transcriptional regulator [Pelagibacterium montanilacus]
MEDRTKTALSSMRKILRRTELNSKALMRETGLTPSQLVFMQLLEDGNEQTAGHIAARMGITQATATALIHKLERQGMVVRRKGESDRRQVWLSLTDAGRDVLAISPDGVHARFHEAFRALEDWEQLMLIAALERVAGMLGAEDGDAAAIFDASDTLAPREALER